MTTRSVRFEIRTEELDGPEAVAGAGGIKFATGTAHVAHVDLACGLDLSIVGGGTMATHKVESILTTTRYPSEDEAIKGGLEVLGQAFVDAFADPEVEGTDLDALERQILGELDILRADITAVEGRLDDLD